MSKRIKTDFTKKSKKRKRSKKPLDYVSADAKLSAMSAINYPEIIVSHAINRKKKSKKSRDKK